jgi:hypothetical protein
MKNLILFCFILLQLDGLSQNGNCIESIYNNNMKKGDSICNSNGDINYSEAIRAYFVAMVNCSEKSDSAMKQIRKVIDKMQSSIDDLKSDANTQAIEQASEIKKQKDSTDNVLKKVKELEKELKIAKNDLQEAGIQNVKITEDLNVAIKQIEIKDREKEELKMNIERFKETKIGKKYQGGRIFYVDATGEHGLIAAEYDLPGRYNWKDAKKYCDDYSKDDYSDWRLPTKDELDLLCKLYFMVGNFVHKFYWSSSEFEDDNDYAWLENLTHFQNYKIKRNGNRVRPVRSF